MATVGNVDKCYIKSSDSLGNESETLISTKLKINPAATYTQIVDSSRALMQGVSFNSYQDTILITRVSALEKAVEEDEEG